MRAARQPAQHGGGIGCIQGLAEDLVVQDHLGVGAQHHGTRRAHHLQQAGACLLAGDPAHVLRGGFAGLAIFGDVEVDAAERETQAGQQFGATGGLGSQVEHPGRITRGA
ncbi:hypothetical protein FQZ97_1017390 [compost metagenome]